MTKAFSTREKAEAWLLTEVSRSGKVEVSIDHYFVDDK